MGTTVIVRMKENEFHNICVSTAINKDLEKCQQQGDTSKKSIKNTSSAMVVKKQKNVADADEKNRPVEFCSR